jgi:hypothetical protein
MSNKHEGRGKPSHLLGELLTGLAGADRRRGLTQSVRLRSVLMDQHHPTIDSLLRRSRLIHADRAYPCRTLAGLPVGLANYAESGDRTGHGDGGRSQGNRIFRRPYP